MLLAALCAAATLLVPAVAADAYPPTTCSTVSVSTTTPQPGQQITVAGSHFKPEAHITVALDTRSHPLAHVTSNAMGHFSTRVVLPQNATGRHRIKAFGGNLAGVPGCPATATVAIRFQAGGVSSSQGNNPGVGGAGTGTGTGGGTAFTGVDIAALLAIALALIAVGVLFNRRGAPKRAEAGSPTRT